MRLIDADSLIKELQEQMKTATNPLFAMVCDKCIDYLENQPTAYSIEKVVAELEEKSDDIPIQYEENYEKGFDDGIGYAIDLVRKGGVE